MGRGGGGGRGRVWGMGRARDGVGGQWWCRGSGAVGRVEVCGEGEGWKGWGLRGLIQAVPGLKGKSLLFSF